MLATWDFRALGRSLEPDDLQRLESPMARPPPAAEGVCTGRRPVAGTMARVKKLYWQRSYSRGVINYMFLDAPEYVQKTCSSATHYP